VAIGGLEIPNQSARAASVRRVSCSIRRLDERS
jgi:hypothetical protein